MASFEERLGYKFNNKSLLDMALSHSSYVNECKKSGAQSNERLEFLGDSVLSLITAEYLYKKYVQYPEGVLTKTRASVVCERSLAVFAREIDLGSSIKCGKGELGQHGNFRDSILSDAYEAVMAAVYLDGGLETVKKVYETRIIKAVDEAIVHCSNDDYKTRLQEIVQKNRSVTLAYEIVGESGPDHDKRFEAQVLLDSNPIARGIGHSKKDAEQHAAKAALTLMGELDG